MYVIIAISTCVLCQFKVCCDVHRRRNRDSNFYNNYTKINDLMLNCLPVVIYVIFYEFFCYQILSRNYENRDNLALITWYLGSHFYQ